jgi:hypothetical protein
MTTQHTPGPWKAISPHPGQWAICKESHQKHLESWTVAYVRDFQKQDEANARLIAAAPELLEALKGLYGSLAWHIDNHGGFGMDECRMNQALAVITKATQD